MFLPRGILAEKLLWVLAEDLGQGDVTTALVVPSRAKAEARVIAKEAGVAAGIEEAEVLLDALELGFKAYVGDGADVMPWQTLLEISGDARTILSVERTLLNLISRMSGIATATRRIVEKIKSSGYKARVACTRKTAPGLMYFDKKAVLVGGGDPHRLHLDDMLLIKDNHVVFAGGVENAVKIAREKASFSKKIEVEVSNLGDVLAAAKAGADIIMLDNFSPNMVDEAINLLRKEGFLGKVLVEVSGRITAENVIDFASRGVDIISLGEITHSVKAFDVSLEIIKQ
ncbi:MAG: carboxylating nicotinate-nucleotide diphosphorylase [Candidatus Bathyarchaeota archaeon]|nr:carboxylating nicotinate-nucleotide diphosphorylase [Candidatus Bathyarchaeota archaeon]MCX8177325.1 carboxylating nicotinate-nucleotide diphosphorylase [Candidatus Bathyarchaeota archaeon]MDW8193771.1 carboxylating nicotinate-nucleotide diphosphorylase [Nitrososphaerota archaeon]